jgi:hypothetical protein
MTKPTGRPRGRPKTKEYVTLMARVDITLADEVKRYASLHRQPISVVIRDALTLLMEEYPCAADRSAPHRLAAHEFLSDRYESPLDMLLGESDGAELEELLSDTNREVVEAMLSDTNGEDEYASDTKEVVADITSDDNTDRAAVPTRTPAHARSRKVSDRKVVDDNTSDTKMDAPPIMSGKKEATAASLPEPRAPAFVSDTNVPVYNTSKHYLGKLCPRRHDYHGTGQSLLRKTNHLCLACDRERAKARRQPSSRARPLSPHGLISAQPATEVTRRGPERRALSLR